MRIGICAPSSAIGSVEFELGLRQISALAPEFSFTQGAHLFDRDYVHAGTDEHRAADIIDFAYDDAIDVLWSARGGDGAARLLPLLEAATRERGKPKRKLFVGYSDITVLHEWLRANWGWSTLHGLMIATNLCERNEGELTRTIELIRGNRPTLRYATQAIDWIGEPPSADVTAELYGGNLSLVHTLAGTQWQPSGEGRMLFLEDTNEKVYAIDRYAVQMEQAGMFEGLKAVILGDFTHCQDESPSMVDPSLRGTLDLKTMCDPDTTRVPLRPTLSLREGLARAFGRICAPRGIALGIGLPVGHGPNFEPLPLGATYTLTRDARLLLTDWQWRA